MLMVTALAQLKQLFHRVRGSDIEFNLGPYRKPLAAVRKRRKELARLDNDQLREASKETMALAHGGVPLEDLMVDAFALVREASLRVLGMGHYDVQIMAGMALHQGKLVEMQTGEGKTLAAVLPAYLNALTHQGIHILTFNDYLAKRDAEWMGPVYRFLGLSVGFIQEGMSLKERQKAYGADITYLTAKEAGFDYLRDHLCREKGALVHRPFHFALVDEADSNLIDEARVPLVIAGSERIKVMDHYVLADIVRSLTPLLDYNTDEYSRNVHLTEHGFDHVEFLLKCGSLHDPENLLLLNQLYHALHAEVLLRKDVDYIVRNGIVEIIDEFTGRVVENRRWPEGLQAAVEAKEKLALRPEGKIMGTITLQHFINLYPKVCGMTATAQQAAEEFKEFYSLTVTVIPPHKKCNRKDHPDRIFTHEKAKIKALLQEIARVHLTGRPILVGTRSVEESDRLSAALRKADIPCQVLNAKNDALEAKIIAQAGALHAVTISTNMAGRGTDIRLGGEREEDRDQVVALGGLYVIGTNRHESRRIDDQLRGRSGRQGDPGSSRFFISLADDLIRRYGIHGLIPPSHYPQHQDDPLTDPVIGREIARAQRIIENQNYEIRRTLHKYALRLEQHRKEVYQWRREVLMEKRPLELLVMEAKDRYAEILDLVGEETLQQVEKEITLFHIDQCWADHLALMAHIREGVYLFSYSVQEPLDEYHRRTAKAFNSFRQRIQDRIVETFHSVKMTENGMDLDREGLRGPSSTWTYQVSDNPMGNWLNRFFHGVHKALTRSLKF
jgi:preprotein translocase subunit SecA